MKLSIALLLVSGCLSVLGEICPQSGRVCDIDECCLFGWCVDISLCAAEEEEDEVVKADFKRGYLANKDEDAVIEADFKRGYLADKQEEAEHELRRHVFEGENAEEVVDEEAEPEGEHSELEIVQFSATSSSTSSEEEDEEKEFAVQLASVGQSSHTLKNSLLVLVLSALVFLIGAIVLCRAYKPRALKGKESIRDTVEKQSSYGSLV